MSTVSTTISHGITVDGVAYTSPLSITSTGKISDTSANGNAVLVSPNNYSIANQGTLSASGASGIGVYFDGGGTGTLSNTGASAFIYGTDGAIEVAGAGYITNSGKIAATNTATAVIVINTGSVNNSGTVTGGSNGVRILIAGTVINSGSIGSPQDGVYDYSGSVSNQGRITGADYAVELGTGTISNQSAGYISSTGAGSAAGVFFYKGAGDVVNAGTITGYNGIAISSADTANQTVIDTGAIKGTGGTAISFGSGNDLLQFSNSSTIGITGTVDGGSGTNTLEFVSAASHGTLTGTGAEFVNFSKGTIDSSAYWVFAGTNTIGSTTTLTNSGSLVDSGTLQNAGTIKGTGTAHGISFNGVTLLAGASFTNAKGGYLGLISADYQDVTPLVYAKGATANVTNLGTIKHAEVGISLTGGGIIHNGATNNTTATIYTYDGVISANTQSVTVFNYGSISSRHVGLGLGNPGYLANGVSGSTAALLEGESGVVFYGRAGTVKNFGTIMGTTSGSVIYTNGVFMGYGSGGTVINAGTILGSKYSINLEPSETPGRYGPDGSNRVVLYPTSFLNSKVRAAGTANVLEFASAASHGTISHFNTGYIGFKTTTIDGGSQWTITGANTLKSGYTLTNAGTLTVPAYLVDKGAFTNTGSLLGSGTIKVDPTIFTNAGYDNDAFILTGSSELDNTSTGTINVTGFAVSGDLSLETVVNAGSIAGAGSSGIGVNLLGGGSVTNGTTADTTASVTGYLVGLNLLGTSTVVNYGTVKAAGTSGTGVYMYAGLLTNGSPTSTAALIEGAIGIEAAGAAVGVTTYGTIEGTGATGIGLDFLNSSVVIEGSRGASAGLISGAQAGIQLNGSYATTLYIYGVVMGGAGVTNTDGSGTATQTIVDGGTIIGTGGTAVQFNAGADLFRLLPGNVEIEGTVAGGGGSDTLELTSAATTGTLTGVGADFTGFSTIELDSGASWVLAGNDTFGNNVSLVDKGTLTITGTVAANVYAAVATPITIASTGSLTNGGTGQAIYAIYNSTPVINAGTITATGNAITDDAVKFKAGGSLHNTGFISGHYGAIAYGYLTVTNLGTIGTASSRDGLFLRDGGGVSNSGLITGSGGIAGPTGSFAVSVVNSGTVSGQDGMTLGADTAAATVVDSGTITGLSGDAVQFGSGNDLMQFTPSSSVKIQGTVDGGGGTNTLEFASASSHGTVTGVGADFVNFSKGTIDSGAYWAFTGSNTIGSTTTLTDSGTLVDTGILTNAGTIAGSGKFIVDSATFINSGYNSVQVLLDASALNNISTGTIKVSGTHAIYGYGSYVTNAGLIEGAGLVAVDLLAGGTVTNLGTVTDSTGAGIYLLASGTVTNGASNNTTALISGYLGIGIAGTAHVTNYATITGASGAGIYLSASGTVTNGASNNTTALVSGYSGVVIAGIGHITNYATITGTSGLTGSLYVGVGFSSGTLINAGRISGKDGVIALNTGTVLNSGTIIGNAGTAVVLGYYGTGNNNRLIVDPGAVFQGVAAASGSGDVLELASAAGTGTMSGIGASFSGFGTVAVDSGANWVLSGNNTIGAGGTLSDAGTATVSGTLDNAGIVLLSGSAAQPAVLTDSGLLGGVVGFAPGAGDYSTLRLTNTLSLPGTIIGFTGPHDVVDLTSLAYVGGSSGTQFDTASNRLTVVINGTSSAVLQLGTGSYGGASWTVENDGSGGSDVLLGAPQVTEALVDDTGSSSTDKITEDPAVTGGGDDDATVTISEGATTLGTTTADGSGVWSFTSTGLADGAHTLVASETNITGTGTASLSFTLDTTAPAVAVTSSSGGITNQATQTIAGTVSDANLAAIPTITLFDNGTQIGTTTASGGAWSTSITLPGQGANNITAQATDLAGNIGTSNTEALSLDTVPPTVTPASLIIPGDSTAQAIGIAVPTDTLPFTITATGLPTNGSVTLSDGTTAVIAGEVLTAAQLTGLEFTPAPGLFNANSRFTYSVTDTVGNSTNGSAILGIEKQSPTPPGSLTGDGVSDTLMTNTTGALVLDEMSGGQMGYTQIGGLGPEWQFEGMGPLLGDGMNGFLLWDGDSTTPEYGAVVVGEDVSGTAQYTQISSIGPEWQFEGAGAFTGGDAGFLLWDDNSATPEYGALVVGTILPAGDIQGGTAQYTRIGGLGPEWQLEGVGNYLGASSSDFLLWDTGTASPSYGAVVVGQDVGGTAQYTAVGGLDPTVWQFEGSGDLLNDGKASFLIRYSNGADPNNGALVVGEVSGSTLQYTQIGSVGAEWQFVGTGDYDGSSQAEFLMRNQSTGALVIGTVANATASYTQVGGVGSEWNFHTINVATLL